MQKIRYNIKDARKFWGEWLPGADGKLHKQKDVIQYDDDKFKEFVLSARKARYITYPFWIEIMQLTKFSGLNILEIGANMGHDAVTMAKHGAKIVAVDFVKDNIALLHRYAKLMDTEIRGVYVDSLMDFSTIEKFDIIFASGCIHHMIEPKPIIEHISQYLKDGGLWFTMLYTPLLDYSEPKHGREGTTNEYYRRTYTVSDVQEILPRGFFVLEYQPFNTNKFVKVVWGKDWELFQNIW